MKKRLTALLLAGLLIGISGCTPLRNTLSYSGGSDAYVGIADKDSTAPKDDSGITEKAQADADAINKKLLQASGGKGNYAVNWVDSDVIGRVKDTDTFRLQDDFAAAVNRDWILSSDEYSITFQEAQDTVFEKEVAILEKMAGMEGKSAEEFNKYYELAMDWETRNAQGVDTLKKYLQYIDDISNREELYAWIADREKNPCGIAPIIYAKNARSEKNPSQLYCGLEIPVCFLESEENYYDFTTLDKVDRKMLKEQELFILLDALGYSETQKKDLIRSNYRMEKKLLSAKTKVSIEQVDPLILEKGKALELAGSYPLEAYLSSFGVEGVESVVADKKLLKKMDKLCGNGNLENMKAFLKVQYIIANYYNLDRNLFNQIGELNANFNGGSMNDIADPEQLENKIFFGRYLATSPMSAALEEVYLKEYVSEEQKERLEKLVKDVIDSYREVLLSEDWISEEGKKLAVEKLDNIVTHVVSPDMELVDYEKLNIVSKQDGGSFLEAQFQVSYFTKCIMAECLSGEFDRNTWNPFLSLSTLTTNAYYAAQDNAIYILAGVCEAPLYYDGMSDEELLGAVGVIIAHELTHGFDQAGIKYDKDGIYRDWFPSQDKMSFNDKILKLNAFYTALRPFDQSPYNGAMVSTEATADLGGMKITLNIAKKNPNFDYDKYFRAEAAIWRTRIPEKAEKVTFESDGHPLPYLRVNALVAQFDEFYETYNVQPGDGMYIEPEKRLEIW